MELQILRQEEAEINGNKNNETNKIQNLQICDGNVNKNIEIPFIYLWFFLKLSLVFFIYS